jgi:hypothetical protein
MSLQKSCKIVRKHHVYPEEVEEAFLRRPTIRFMERGHRPDEDLYAAFGQSDAGRYLAVYFILKPGPAGKIITQCHTDFPLTG